MRYQIFRGVIVFLFGLLLAGLFYTQVVEGPRLYRKSEHNRIRLIPLAASRGDIYDKNGLLLATSRPSYNISILPGDLDPKDLPELARVLKISRQEIEEKIKKAKKVPFMPVVLARGVDLQTLFLIEEKRPDFEGVIVQVESIRSYPLGEKAAHLVGYVGMVSKQELDQDEEKKFQSDDRVGRMGIEKGLDSVLRGENGGLQVEVDSRGRQTQILSERKTQKGRDITLTIDGRLQSRIEELFQNKKGVVGMMDLKTGGILAWVSEPSFDPNIFVDPARMKERGILLKNPSHPLIDRGLRATYPPGSLFKIVTALAALEKNKVNERTSFFCNGFFRLAPGSRPFKCWYRRGHQAMNLVTALERSCNVFFYNLGRMLQASEIASMARRLGLGQAQDVEVTYIRGNVPDENWKQERFHDRWYQGETISYAIGQGYLSVTPLELMRMMGALALETEIPPAHFVESGRLARKKLNVSPEDIQLVKKGLFKVVQSDYGTGQYGRVDFMKMAGKTGTAQAARGEDHAWFGGFFPFERPEVAFICFVEHGKSGGLVAGKLMHEVVKAWRDLQERGREMEIKAPAAHKLKLQPVRSFETPVSSSHVRQ
ncbi:MAG: penicillin-binding protein 2 [Candidatus Omnitrophica bacterium]|nr:penicillin-binding protein 2 [Candidatus Omnitrophota bacterium]